MNINSSFELEQVAIGTIEKMLQATNANKAAGIDNLPGLFVKDGAFSASSNPNYKLVNCFLAFSRSL